MRIPDAGNRVQRAAPAHIPKLTPFVLPLEQVRPAIRLSHRPVGQMTLRERIITDYELVLFLRGNGQFIMRDRVLPIVPHLLLTIPPFLPHGFTTDGVAEHIAVHFDFAPNVPRFARQPDRRPPYEVKLVPDLEIPLHRVLTPSDGIEEALVALERDWSRRTPEGTLAAQGRLALAISQLARPRGGAADAPRVVAEDAPLRRALEHMRERFAEPLTMGDCARAAGMSPTRFAHRFRDHTGYAPMEYLRRLRVERARQLLADPSLTVKEVAARVGYPDQYHFSRVFRSVDGLPPTQYREAALANRSPRPRS